MLYLILLILTIIILVLLNVLIPNTFKITTEKIKPYTTWITLLTVLYFVLYELPKFNNENSLANEQRRIYFWELLANSETPNRVREEVFVKLISDYNVKDFSGVNLTNKNETQNTSFNFYRCFRNFDELMIDNDTLVYVTKNNSNNRNNKVVYLKNLYFWNTNLQYANFSHTTRLRSKYQTDVLIWDDEFQTTDYIFQLQYLTDTNLSYCNMRGIKIKNGNLNNVSLIETSLANAEFKNTWFDYCDLSGADLTGSNLDSVAFVRTKFSEETDFSVVNNFESIILASPYVIYLIKKCNQNNEKIKNWHFEWNKFGGSPDIHYNEKWDLWLKLNKDNPKTALSKYISSIKIFYLKKYDKKYDWQREL